MSVLINTQIQVPIKQSIKLETTIGIDFGIKTLATLSNGIVFENKHFFKKNENKLKIEQRSLARKVKQSKNYIKQKLKVALLHEKVRNQRTDYLHKISSYLVKNYDTIVLEDLSVKSMMQNRSLSKAINDVSWNELRTMITYKCDWYGKNLKIIGRFEPSSKICSNCGNIKHDLTLKNRTYVCSKCGFELDRDLNASINIKTFGLRDQPLSAKVRH